MKKISLFALAFAVVGLSACAEEAEPVDETTIDAEVVTPVEPADDMMMEADSTMDEMGDEMEEMGDEMEAATDTMAAE